MKPRKYVAALALSLVIFFWRIYRPYVRYRRGTELSFDEFLLAIRDTVKSYPSAAQAPLPLPSRASGMALTGGDCIVMYPFNEPDHKNRLVRTYPDLSLLF